MLHAHRNFHAALLIQGLVVGIALLALAREVIRFTGPLGAALILALCAFGVPLRAHPHPGDVVTDMLKEPAVRDAPRRCGICWTIPRLASASDGWAPNGSGASWAGNGR